MEVRALLLELVEGPRWPSGSRRGPIPVAEALSIARQIAEALEAAHEKRHRPPRSEARQHQDHGDGVVKVLDFGLAKGWAEIPVSPDARSPTATGDARTRQSILGTAAYMSPEQARGRVGR